MELRNIAAGFTRTLFTRTLWILEIALPCLLVLEGCGGTTGASSPGDPPPQGIAFHGKLMSGQHPVANAAVQMYAAGSGGYGAAATPLSGTVNTAVDGTFSIADDYTCPANDSPVYLAAQGGSPAAGGAGGASNPALVLLAAVGSCSDIDASTMVTINEVLTVAAAYALAAFLGPNAQIGSSATNSQGLQNAFANVANLVDPASGTSPGKSAPAGAAVQWPASGNDLGHRGRVRSRLLTLGRCPGWIECGGVSSLRFHSQPNPPLSPPSQSNLHSPLPNCFAPLVAAPPSSERCT
jgi:hypothetical protein